MKVIWNYLEGMNWRAEAKYRAALLMIGTSCALIGFAVWLIIRNFFLSSLTWMICFIGYPVVISWFFVFFYSCNHAFHDGGKE